jgi:hypothetical protein
MALYHGTKKELLPTILREGLKTGKYDSGGTRGIWLALVPEDALNYGKVVLKVDVEVDGPISPEQWQCLCMQDVPSSRIRVMSECVGCGKPTDPDIITCESCAKNLSAQMLKGGNVRREG